MPRMIAIANQKGGVGKTTVTVNLGVALAELGRRALLIDLDPQASLTLSLGQVPDAQERAIYDALLAAADGEPTPLSKITIRAGDVDLIPSNIGLSVADVELSGPLGAFALRDALETLPARYDYVLIDCPPNLGVLTLSALLAAGEVLIPLSADYLSTRGLVLLTDQIRKVQRVNPSLRVLGVLLTRPTFARCTRGTWWPAFRRWVSRAGCPSSRRSFPGRSKSWMLQRPARACWITRPTIRRPRPFGTWPRKWRGSAPDRLRGPADGQEAGDADGR